MRYLEALSGLAMAVFLVACGDDDGGATPDASTQADARAADASAGFPQPSGTVPVNFSVDDTANRLYMAGTGGASELQWKGGMIYDSATRKITPDGTWSGPWAPLYDDGPWTAGGHEPAGATAGDQKWGITVFATVPAMGMTTYAYGLIDSYYEMMFGNGWIWPPPDGEFIVYAGAMTAITAAGTTIPAHGTTDLQITLDPTMLADGTWNTSMVRIKGSSWAWGLQPMTMADGKYTFTLSSVVGAGKPLKHSGLLESGDKPEFTAVFGSGSGKEYEDASGNGILQGFSAAVKPMGASTFTPVEVVLFNTNASIVVP
jgi:hypothetical protein